MNIYRELPDKDKLLFANGIFNDIDKSAEVFKQWGFWHMGQFAKDYKFMFGQLPSETLNS
jgi:hypothetical protein